MNLKELLTGNPNRLRYVVRFGNCFRHKDESVAEHSFYVAFYCLVIGEYLEWTGHPDIEGINFERLLSHALLHDVEEAITGDFPRPFKYASAQLKRQLDKGAELGCKLVFENLTDSERMKNGLFWKWKHAKGDNQEGAILDFADYLACLSYLWTEIGANNQSMKQHVKHMREYHEVFNAPRFDFLRDLHRQAGDLLREAFSEEFPE